MALEVAAAVIGILAAAGKVAETLAPVVSAYRDSTRNAAVILSEINNARFTLVSLHALFDNIYDTPRRRRKLIQVDQLITSLTDGVLLFSELEAIVSRLDPDPNSIGAKIVWAWKDDQLSSLVSRMQRFQTSMSLMLNILQCISEVEADYDRQTLLSVTTALLESNLELTKRIARLEDTHTVAGSSKSTRRPASLSATETADSVTINNLLEDLKKRPSSMPTEAIWRAQYERDLESSRVYRKVRRISSLLSFRSSIALTHAWTTLSDISLSDISVISVVALPLMSEDIENDHHYNFLGPTNQSQLKPSTSNVAERGATSQAPRKIKIVVKGTKEAEINDLVAKFVGPHCIPGSDDGIINCYEKLWDVDGIPIHLQIQAITDLHGIDIDRHLRNGQNFMIVRSILSSDSSYRTRKDAHRIKRWKGDEFHTLIYVNNHFDRDDPGQWEDQVEGVVYPLNSSAGVDTTPRLDISYCHVSEREPFSVDVPFRALVRARLKQEEKLASLAMTVDSRLGRIGRGKLRAQSPLGVIEEK